MFIDDVIITVRSGAGGKGCESFNVRPDRKRIPTGGDGGAGGDVILRADSQTGSLLPLKSKRIFEAERGEIGMGSNQYGRKGKDVIVKVPCGTTIYNQTDDLLIRDLVYPGDEVVVLKGGRGGYGNHARKPATPGGEAGEIELLLSFKIIADIFIVGLPNSGKTSLLKLLTGAHVTETDYPFATKAPQLGTYKSNTNQLSLCELPSIYGASEEGRGLGTHSLKHLERARLIFFVLDVKSEFTQSIKEGYKILLNTVKGINNAFLNIPRFIVVNKSDLMTKKDQKIKLPKEKVYYISVKEKIGIDQLMKDAQKVLA